MYGFIGSLGYFREIKEFISSQEGILAYKILGDDIDIISEINNVLNINVNYLIIDLGALNDEKKIVQALEKYKKINSKTQIIVIIPLKFIPGNPTISELVKLGVYDIIRHELEQGSIEDFLLDHIVHPTPYRKVKNWEIIEEEIEKEAEEIQKEENIDYKTEDKYSNDIEISEEDKENEKDEDDEEDYNQKVKYVVKEKYITEEVFYNIPNKLIVVVNFSKRAGSSFVSMNLAKYMSNFNILTSLIEPPLGKPYMFDTIDMELRLNKSNEEESLKFYSYPHVIDQKQKVIRGKEITEEDIIWIIPDSRRPLIKDWDYFKMMRLLYSSKKATINILDIGDYLNHQSVEPIIFEADLVLVVVEPLPTELMQNNDRLQKLLKMEKKGAQIEFIINKYADGINKKEVIEYLRKEPKAYIPSIEREYIYEAVYNSKIPIMIQEVGERLDEPFYQIVKDIVPPKLLKKENKKSFKLQNLFKQFRR